MIDKLKTFYYALSFWVRAGGKFRDCLQDAEYEVEWRKQQKQ